MHTRRGVAPLGPAAILALAACLSHPERRAVEPNLAVEVLAADGAVVLVWEPVAGATGYRVYTSVGAPFERTGIPLQFQAVPESFWMEDGLENGVSRYYVVTAFSDEVETHTSAEVVATPVAGRTGCVALPPREITDTSVVGRGIVVNPPGQIASPSFDVGAPAYGRAIALPAVAAPGAWEVAAEIGGLAGDTDVAYRVVVDGGAGRCTGTGRVARTWPSPQVLATGLAGPTALALGAGTVYVAERYGDRVSSVPASGGAANVLAAAAHPTSLALHGAALYALDDRGVVRLDASTGATTVISEGYTGGNGFGLRVHGESLFWRAAALHELPLAGGAPSELAPGAASFDVDGGSIYWAAGGYPSAIYRRALGAGGQPILLATPYYPKQLLVVGGWLYYGAPSGTERGIWRLPVSGGAPERVSAANASPDAADATHLYFAEGSLVRRIPLGGGEVGTLAYSAPGIDPFTVAVDDTHVYWLAPGNPGALLRAPKAR